MDSNHNQPPLEEGDPSPWMRHAAWNNVPIDQFPTAPAPIIYEGFVPQQTAFESNHIPQYSHQPYHYQDTPDLYPHNTFYPPVDHHFNHESHIGGPVQPPEPRSNRRSTTPRFTPALGPSYHTSRILPQYDDVTSDDDLPMPDANEVMSSIETIPEVPSLYMTSQSSGRGQGRGRGRGRGGGRSRKREKQRGGWNRGTKTGLREVLDPGEEFNAIHKEATEAFVDEQDYEKALDLILKAISINPEIYSAHVLLSEIYFAKDDDERGIAALFSGAHASPNDPDIWHQLADVCLQQTSLDRFTLLKQASYCFQRLLQIDSNDDDARFQKAAVSRELGHHARALKDLDHLLQKMPHNSSILRQIAEICLDMNDAGRAIGLYDDALEYHKLAGTMNEDTFNWSDLIVYVDLITKVDGPAKGMRVMKTIARSLLGREDEAYWDNYVQDDREWDADHIPRRMNALEFLPDQHPVEAYGIGLPMELRVKLGDFRLKNGDRQEALKHFEWLAPDQRGEESPLYEYTDLFLQVADALREVKEFQLGLRYYEALHSIEACDDIDFWLGFGACSYVCEKRDQAMYCYEAAKEADPTSGEARTQLSKLYAAKGDRETAIMFARTAIILCENQIPKTERRKYERKDLREAREAAQKAFKDAYKLPKPPNADGDQPEPSFSRRAREKARRLAREAAKRAELEEEEEAEEREGSLEPLARQDGLRSREEAVKQMMKKRRSKKERTKMDRHETIRQLFSTLCSVTEAMREGDDVSRNIWMDCAEALVDEFRTERVLYPAERYIKFRGYDRRARGAHADPNDDAAQPQEDMPLPSVESAIPDDYCGIVFTTWLDIFLEYAMLLANLQEDNTECYTVINAALDCNVWFHDTQAILQIYTCWLACALALRDEVTLFNTVIRWFMREFMFCTDTYRLFQAMNYFYPHQNDKGGKAAQMNNAVFRSAPNQKYIFRQIMGLDRQLPEDYGSDQPDGPVPEFMRRPYTDVTYIKDRPRQKRIFPNHAPSTHTGTVDPDGDDDEGPSTLRPDTTNQSFSPQELDVVLLTLYAQILYTGGSFPNALSYFFRAYNLAPKNTVVLLSIALCYMHQMLKRQNENRHMYVLQGWSFFEEYAAARVEWAVAREGEGWPGLVVAVKREVEFNRARCWQMLGMSDLAVRSFGRMLDLRAVKAEDEMDVEVSEGMKDVFSREAAYAMVTIYAMNGDMDHAREITEKYLVVE